jgi:predicted DNA-binding protein
MAKSATAKKAGTSKMSVALPDDTRARLEALALRMEQTTAECIDQAIAEFIENWEDHLRVVAALAEDEARPVLSGRIERD